MTTCTIPVLQINPNECIGDSVGKHNYNFIALDTSICNLNSNIYGNDGTLLQTLTSTLKNLSEIYPPIISDITEKRTEEFLIAATTVSLLSSYWGNYEFSISLPINAISLSQNDAPLLCPILSTVSFTNLNETVNSSIRQICLDELNQNYAAYEYNDNTIVNVSVLFYNLLPTLSQGTSDPLIQKAYLDNSPPVFSFNNRFIHLSFSRDNAYVTTGLILRFTTFNGQWEYMGYIHDGSSSTATPNKNIQSIYQTINAAVTANSAEVKFINTCQPIIPDNWYSTDIYVYANSYYTGTPSRLGTITLTLRTPTNETSVFSYTAPGYDPATDTGGNDVYLEYDGPKINAYVEYPTQKTLVQSWDNPYYQQAGINFKFSSDGNGVSFNLCASTPV